MSKLLLPLIGCLYIFSLLSCSSAPLDHTNTSYESLIGHFTDRAEYYQGFVNVFQFQATILNEEVLKAQADIKAESFKWTQEQKDQEEKQIQDSLRSETKVFLSFYSPEPKIDDLLKAQTVWRIFLDVNNKRYMGTVSKYVGIPSETVTFYPYYTRFSSAYIVKFPVPMVNIQDFPIQFTMTGTVGSKTINFVPMK